MNIARGLFRIWIVCAVLWVAGFGLLGADRISEDLTTINGPVERVAKDEWIIAKCGAVSDPAADSCTFLAVADKRTDARGNLMVVLGFVLVTPLAVLIMGYAFVWAFRGFRNPTAS